MQEVSPSPYIPTDVPKDVTDRAAIEIEEKAGVGVLTIEALRSKDGAMYVAAETTADDVDRYVYPIADDGSLLVAEPVDYIW